MIQIRGNAFETNSSSTHSICIQKKPVELGSFVYFGLGNYGWENREVDIRDYLYTAIMCCSKDTREKYLKKLKSFLIKNNIKYEFEQPGNDGYENAWLYRDYGIDHDYETIGFVDAVLNDEDMLMRLLFGADSVVYTGNDNQDVEDYPMCEVANEWRLVKEDGEWKRKKTGNWNNEYYDPDNYDYFYKEN